MRVLICPCGEGLGHTTRCRALAEEFIKEGHKVAFAAYGYSADYLRKYGFRVYASEAEISLAGKAGKFSMKESILNSKSVFYRMAKAAYRECRAIDDFRADIVVSDSKYSALLAAKIKGLKSIIIINQNNMKVGGIKKFVGYAVNTFIKNLNKMADRIVVPDFAPPYAVSGHILSEKKNRMRFVGPLIISESWRGGGMREKYILSQIGGFGYRTRILKTLGKLAEKRKGKNFRLVCGVSKIRGLKSSGNLKVAAFEKNMDGLWRDCEMVVSHAGHSSLMEMLCFGKPGIIIPDAGQFEQESNAKKISELGCGIVIPHDKLSVKTLDCAISRIEKDSSYKKNAKKMSALARKYNAKKTIVGMAVSLARSGGARRGVLGRFRALASGMAGN